MEEHAARPRAKTAKKKKVHSDVVRVILSSQRELIASTEKMLADGRTLDELVGFAFHDSEWNVYVTVSRIEEAHKKMLKFPSRHDDGVQALQKLCSRTSDGKLRLLVYAARSEPRFRGLRMPLNGFGNALH